MHKTSLICVFIERENKWRQIMLTDAWDNTYYLNDLIAAILFHISADGFPTVIIENIGHFEGLVSIAIFDNRIFGSE